MNEITVPIGGHAIDLPRGTRNDLQRTNFQLIEQTGINVAQAAKVIEALNDREFLFDLEAVELNDKPRIELKDGDAYKDSLSISKGQKCTSILPILLLDSEQPRQ